MKKGYDFIRNNNNFNSPDSVVQLGVGKNMVASIRFWMRAFGLTQNDELQPIAEYLFDANRGKDPFVEDLGTLWLLHFLLVSTGEASLYNLLFVELQKEQNLIFWNLLEWWKKRFLNQDCDVRFADNAGGMTFAAAKKAAGRTYKIKMMVLQNKMINQVTNTVHNMKQIFRNL